MRTHEEIEGVLICADNLDRLKETTIKRMVTSAKRVSDNAKIVRLDINNEAVTFETPEGRILERGRLYFSDLNLNS